MSGMFFNGGAMGIWGWTMMGGFWVLVILAIVWGVRSTRLANTTGQSGNALRILDERLAGGEINVEEYEERRAILETRRRGDNQQR